MTGQDRPDVGTGVAADAERPRLPDLIIGRIVLQRPEELAGPADFAVDSADLSAVLLN
jgi:hypothetical protein